LIPSVSSPTQISLNSCAVLVLASYNFSHHTSVVIYSNIKLQRIYTGENSLAQSPQIALYICF